MPITIVWPPSTQEQLDRINRTYPFDRNAFTTSVDAWIRAEAKNWSTGSSHSREFPVSGPAKSLLAVVHTEIRSVTDYFEVVTAVYRD